VIIKLKRDANHFRPRFGRKRRDNGTIDTARHGNDNAAGLSGAIELKEIKHNPALGETCRKGEPQKNNRRLWLAY
jgi:hypothetical protein